MKFEVQIKLLLDKSELLAGLHVLHCPSLCLCAVSPKIVLFIQAHALTETK